MSKTFTPNRPHIQITIATSPNTVVVLIPYHSFFKSKIDFFKSILTNNTKYMYKGKLTMYREPQQIEMFQIFVHKII